MVGEEGDMDMEVVTGVAMDMEDMVKPKKDMQLTMTIIMCI